MSLRKDHYLLDDLSCQLDKLSHPSCAYFVCWCTSPFSLFFCVLFVWGTYPRDWLTEFCELGDFFWRKISLQPGVFCWVLSVRFSFLIFCIISGSKDIANWILYLEHHTVKVCPPVSLLFSCSPICGAGSERLSFTGLDSSSGGLKCWDRKLKSLSSYGRLVPLSVWLQLDS